MLRDSVVKRPFQFGLRAMLALVAVAGVVYGCIAYVQKTLSGLDAHGPIVDRSEWSPPLKVLLSDAQSAGIAIEPVDVYLAHGFYVDFYYVWRMNASTGLVSHLTHKWGLGQASAPDIAQFWRDMPECWATPNSSSQRRYYAAHRQKSDNFIVMVNDTTQLVYVWYWFNF